MTKSKIIFDVFVEEMAQQRVMRQFGLLQLELPPPIENPVPAQRLCREEKLVAASIELSLVQKKVALNYNTVHTCPQRKPGIATYSHR